MIANDRVEMRTRHLPKTILQHTGCSKGQNGSVGIPTRYRLDGLGVESWWGEIFHTNPGRSQDPHNLLHNDFEATTNLVHKYLYSYNITILYMFRALLRSFQEVQLYMYSIWYRHCL